MISIIVPAHNELQNLEKLLPWLEEIGPDDGYEVIVSLSNKSCGDVRLIDQYVNTRIVACHGKGRALQMNEGARRAKGTVLVFLHADVWPPKDFFFDILKTLSQGYDAGFFSYRFDSNNFLLRLNASFTKKDGIFTGGGDQCLFIQKSVFKQLGRFNDNQVLMEDFEFFNCMKKANIPYKIVKNDLIVSARKYDHNSYLRVNLSNLVLMVLFKCNHPPEKLARLHDILISRPS